MDAADRPDPAQMAIFARMRPEQKFRLLRQVREETLALKAAWLRTQHPDEDEIAIRRRVRAWQLHGRAELD